MSRFSIGFVLKGVKYLEMRNGKLNLTREAILAAFFRPAGLRQFAYFEVEIHFCEIKMYEIRGKHANID